MNINKKFIPSLLIRIDKNLKNSSYLSYALKLFALLFIIQTFAVVLRIMVNEDLANEMVNKEKETILRDGKAYSFLLSVIIAPLAETFIFQHIPIKAVYFIRRKFFSTSLYKKWINPLAILILGSIFGLAHSGYGIMYVWSTAFSGIYYCSVYIYSKENARLPFWTVVLLHALGNLIAFAGKAF